MIDLIADRRRGMALLVVVVLTMLIALAAYRFSFYMESQYRLTRLHEEQIQAELAALSGAELAASVAELSVNERESLGGLFDNPVMLRHVAIDAISELASRAESVDTNWRCGLISAAANGGDSTADASNAMNAIRFGFENESAKLNMQSLLEWDRRHPGHARATLLGLPGATESPVDAWLQGLGITSQRTNAASGGNSSLLDRLKASGEQNDLDSQTDPLKLLWFGGDLNQNYRIDPLELRLAEQLTDSNRSASSTSSSLTPLGAGRSSTQPPAWQRYVTWNSGQRNETMSGQPRINLNESNLQSLHQKLSATWPSDWANFVIAMRQHGASGPGISGPGNSGAGSPVVGEAASATSESSSPDFSKPSSYTFKSVLELVGAVVQITIPNPSPSGDGKASSSTTKQTLRNPFSSDLSEARNYLGRVLDEATVDAAPFTSGRIDVSAAPAEVLAGVPGIDVALAQRIVQQRQTGSGATATSGMQNTIAWLLEGGTVELGKLKEIEPYLTSRNDVYTLQSVGYRDSLSPVYRCTVTIDARQIPARILHHKNWHPWDRGFTMDQLSNPAP